MRKTYVAISRCSTEEQKRKGNSLETQSRAIKLSHKVRDLECIGDFEETVSGWKSTNRDLLNYLYTRIKKGKLKTDYILFQKVDRFCREIRTGISYIEKFKKVGVEINFTDNWIGYNESNSHFMLSVYLGIAENESKNTSLRVKENIRNLKINGYWTSGTAPIGYDKQDIIVDGFVRKMLVPNDYFLVIREILTSFVEGEMTRKELRVKYQKTLGVSDNTFYNLFYSSTYAAHILLEGDYYAGKWEACIDFNIHLKILKKVNQIKSTKKGKSDVRSDDRYYLKRVLKDAEGSFMTASRSKGKTKYYEYYHTRFAGGERIGVELAHQIVSKVFEGLDITEEDYAVKMKLVKASSKDSVTSQRERIKELEDNIALIDESKREIRNLLIYQKMSFEEYKVIESQQKSEYSKLTNELSTLRELRTKIIKHKSVNRLLDIGKRFREGNNKGKSKILSTYSKEIRYLEP